MKTLIITEKPSVAMNICTALGITDNGDHRGYIEDEEWVVSWCFGHLVELAQPVAYGEQYRRWSVESLPIFPEKWKHEVKEESADQFDLLKTLMERDDVTGLVEATDSGREGEAIFRLVYEKSGYNKPFKRLWISSMEESAIQDGFNNLKPGSDYDSLYSSAKCRQEADWLVGINGTRLFSSLYGKTLKVGRVQTPTLAMLVNREAEINNFKPETYYTVHIGNRRIDATSEAIKDKKEAEDLVCRCNGRDASVVSVEKEEKNIAPPALYDLTTLQREASRLFGFTAKQTLDYTQSLYEKKLVTYPRTDSRFLSDDMEETARKVLYLSKEKFDFLKEDKDISDYSRILNSKKVTDHHAIIPTMQIGAAELNELPSSEMKILALVASRLAESVSGRHVYESTKAVLSCEGEEFAASGKTVKDKGWKAIEEAFRAAFNIDPGEKTAKDKSLPELTEGQVIKEVESKPTENHTKPPKHYSEDTLLSSMEKAGSGDMADDVERKGLGTPATRADIIEKLVNDGLIKREKKKMLPTEDGIRLISIMPEILTSAKLTAEWENDLALIAKGEADPDEFMNGIRKMIRDLIEDNQEISEEQRAIFGTETREVLGKCPRCGSDVVKGKYGPYCTNKICRMKLGKAMGKELSDDQVKKLLEGKRILVKGIRSKKGKTFDAYLTPKGISDFSYLDKDGQQITGFQFDYLLEFPK